MKNHYTFLFLLVITILGTPANGHTQNIGFTVPDSVCLNTPVQIVNTTTGASSYYWNFCVADINQPPVGVNLGNINGAFNTPVYLDYVQSNGNYYGFVTNNYPGGLVRLDFGNSLLNTPVATFLGTLNGLIPTNTEGVQIVQNNGLWYLIIVGGTIIDGVTPYLITVTLGSDITNLNPTGVNWGNLGNMSYPHDLYIFQDSLKQWYGITPNTSNNTITRFSFGNDFSKPPTGTNLGNVGILSGPTGIQAIQENGSWYLFVTNATSSTLSLLNFGNSLLNTPTGINIGNPGNLFSTCWDIYVMKYCNNDVAYIINNNSGIYNIVMLNFGSTFTSTPIASNIGNIGNLSFPHSISKIFRVNNDLYSFITNVNNNTLTRLVFKGCSNSNFLGSSNQNPTSILYNQPGVYNINLTIDDGLPSQASLCKEVVVSAPDSVSITRDTIVCNSDSIQLSCTGGYSYNWSPSTGLSNTTIPNPVARPGISTLYKVNISELGGCTAIDSVHITISDPGIITVTKDTSICKGDSVHLLINGNGIYVWQPSSGLSDSSISNPVAAPVQSTKYIVKLSEPGGCKFTDSVKITVSNPKPELLPVSDSICSGDSVHLIASGGNLYYWKGILNNPGLTDSSVWVYPKSDQIYTVKIINTACHIIDSFASGISVTPLPVVQLLKSNDIDCAHNFAILSVSGGDSYSWTPSAGLSDSLSQSPTVHILNTTTYKVAVSAGNHCFSYDSVTVNVEKNNIQPYLMADAFTPNGDGLNDCFGLKGWNGILKIDFSIFNRWGQRIFETNDINGCWDGTFNGFSQPVGTYVYEIHAITICGDVERKGTIVLIR